VPEPYVDAQVIADMLGVTRQQLYRNGDTIGLPSYRIGGARRYLISEIRAWVKSTRTGRQTETMEDGE
jgi:predicted DNA-binding transcriptional regulator AlpA